MTSATTVCMEERPPEHRESGQQPREGTSPITLQFDFSDSKWNHRKRSPTQVIAVSPEGEIYDEHGQPREGMAKPPSGRNGDLDYRYMLGSMTSLNSENEKALLPVIENGSSYDSPDELRDYSSRVPREGGVSLVQHNLVESQPPMNVLSVEPPALSRRPSTFEGLVMTNSSSSSKSLPPPRPPPGPGPGSGPAIRVGEFDQNFKAENPQPPSIQFLEHDQTSPTRKLFPVRSSQKQKTRSRSRQPQRKDSDDDILERIKVLRAEVWGLRSNISEKRNVLREMELAKSIADDKFMKFIRTQGFSNFSLQDKSKEEETLTKLFEECERLRNEYGPLEDDCSILENVLNNREYEMQKLEAALDERWTKAPHIQQETESPQPSPPPSNYSGSEFSQDFHPLVAEYLSKIGDVEIFRERLEWHSEEKLTLEEEKETREGVNLELAEADRKWLENYSEAETTLMKQLEKAEEEAEDLRLKCFSLGLVDEDGEPLDFERQELQNFVADEVDAGTEKSDFVKFPLLLQNPGNKEIQLPDPLPPPDNTKQEDIHERMDPTDRINHWLLQTLRSSPLDVNLLVRTFESIVGHIMEGERWQIDVLTFWYHDGSKELARQYSRSLSEVVTHSKQKTLEQRATLSGRPSISLLVRTSTLHSSKIGEEKEFKVSEQGPLPPSSTVVKKDGG